MRTAGGTAGPISVAMTVRERKDMPLGFGLDHTAIGPEDSARARLIAGSAVAKIDDKTAIAFGFAEGAKAMERRLGKAGAGGFLVARDVVAEPGFSARRDGSVALRRTVGSFGITASAESGDVWTDIRTSATGAPYRLASIAVDRSFGGTRLGVAMTRLDERQSLLGGRLSDALGGGGSNSVFVDAEASQDFGRGWSAGLTARRGWTISAAAASRAGTMRPTSPRPACSGRADRWAYGCRSRLGSSEGGSMLLPTASIHL